ncbi:hypothetical protein ACWCQL_35045 [Streptomyces sp. NPDC002073]
MPALDPHWLRTWAADVTGRLNAVLAAFETYYPYPPDVNEVVLTSPERGRDGVDALREDPAVHPDLVTFYETVEEVTMADIGNAYFIHTAAHAHGELTAEPMPGGAGRGTVFASDGGGTLFAVGQDGTVHRSVAPASTDVDFLPVATDLRDFLTQLQGCVTRFALTRSPGWL